VCEDELPPSGQSNNDSPELSTKKLPHGPYAVKKGLPNTKSSGERIVGISIPPLLDFVLRRHGVGERGEIKQKKNTKPPPRVETIPARALTISVFANLTHRSFGNDRLFGGGVWLRAFGNTLEDLR